MIERSSDAAPHRILDAARVVFGARGFDGAATRDIAAAAGVTQPLIAYHFGNKERLWRAVVDDLFARLAGGVPAGDDPRALVRYFVTFSARHPELHRIIFHECTAPGPRTDWLVDTHVRPLYDRAVAAFGARPDRDDLPATDPVHVYYLVVGAGASLFALAPECVRLTGVDPFTPAVVDRHADAVVDAIFGKARP